MVGSENAAQHSRTTVDTHTITLATTMACVRVALASPTSAIRSSILLIFGVSLS